MKRAPKCGKNIGAFILISKSLVRKQGGRTKVITTPMIICKRQTYLHVIHKRIATRLHHQRIRRRGEWERQSMLAPNVTAKRKE